MKIDDAIRAALKSAKAKGQLEVVAAVTGVPLRELRNILKPDAELTTAQRSLLGMHLRT